MSGPGTPEWVDDHCGDGRIVPITRERAGGILALHAGCDPHCPRWITARAFLDTLPGERSPERRR
ncbi:hypothetical protein ACFXPS_11760 [Nocardia sp. NPDC059091]|uniref:hypothetical protein n=1 Tax=unclassified Nocardia TaxID=2637762 RepID=UPI0036AE1BD6